MWLHSFYEHQKHENLKEMSIFFCLKYTSWKQSGSQGSWWEFKVLGAEISAVMCENSSEITKKITILSAIYELFYPDINAPKSRNR